MTFEYLIRISNEIPRKYDSVCNDFSSYVLSFAGRKLC